jgi:hypothetical protein
MYRHVLLQFIYEEAPAASSLGCVRAGHSVDEFGERDCRYRNLDFPKVCSTDVSNPSTVCRFRSAAMITLESRISPRREDSMAGCALLSLPRHPYRSRRPG